MAKVELSPCPECGGEAKLDRNIRLRYRGPVAKGSEGRYALVRCLDCGFATEKFKIKPGVRGKELDAKAISEWEELCEDKKRGRFSEKYKRALFRLKRKEKRKKANRS